LSTLALTVVGAILIAIVAPDSSVLHLSPTLAALFAVSAMATVIFTLQDSVLLASRKAAWIPFENGVFGAAKIGLLLLFASIATSGAIFASWMLPLAAIVPVVSIFLFRKVLPRQAPGQAAEPVTAETKSNIRKFVSGDAASGMLAQGGIYLLPVLVTVTLGASVNAIFYAAFMLTLTLDLIASNFSAAFVVEGTHSGGPVGALFLSTARKVYAILLPAVAFVIVFAPSIMSIYGPQYEAGASTLRLLALACLPKAILSLFFGFCRIARKTHFSAMCQAVGFIGVLGGAVLGSSRGVTAIALVILVVQCVIVIAILPVMTRMIKDRSIRTKLDFEPTFEDALASEGSAKA
jgi:hypothetical protein